MFDTLSGSISMRCRFDGKQTKMQKQMIGEDESYGTDDTVDFLFGFTGYGYHKCTDPAAFKDEIMASIDAGKPVLAKIKSGSGRFHVITGYDGEALISPHDYWLSRARPGPPAYDELVALYIFGGKITPRYTLKDGLERICRVREANINEKVWDDYLAKMGGWDIYPTVDGLDQADMDEVKRRMERMADTIWYILPHSLQITLRDCCYEEMQNLALKGIWEKIKTLTHYIDSEELAGKLGGIEWSAITPAGLRDISAEICQMIAKFKDDDLKLVVLCKQAIGILKKRQE